MMRRIFSTVKSTRRSASLWSSSIVNNLRGGGIGPLNTNYLCVCVCACSLFCESLHSFTHAWWSRTSQPHSQGFFFFFFWLSACRLIKMKHGAGEENSEGEWSEYDWGKWMSAVISRAAWALTDTHSRWMTLIWVITECTLTPRPSYREPWSHQTDE